MRDKIVIGEIVAKNCDNFDTFECEVDGDLVWYKVPSQFNFRPSVEFYVAITLLEAMYSNRDIVVSEQHSFSPVLLERLTNLQKIYKSWNRDLNIIRIHTGERVREHLKNQAVAVGSFYSGGIDGSFTFCQNIDEITHLIVLKGFDVISKYDQWSDLVDKNKRIAEHYGKHLIHIENNVREFANKRKISSQFQHGLTLAAFALASGFNKVYIPSSFTYSDLFPWGSHPCTDPLWSTEFTAIQHHGADFTRAEKTEFIASFQPVFDNIQVCWKNIAVNCGTCSKCLRTMAASYLLQVQTRALPDMKLEQFSQLKVTSASGVPFIEDLITLAEQRGQKDICVLLRKKVRYFNIKHHASSLFNLLTNRMFVRLYHKLKKTQWNSYRVTLNKINTQ